MEFEMTGIEEIIEGFEDVANEMKKHKKEALEKSGKYYQGKVIEKAPSSAGPEGGNLKRHIEITDVEDDEITIFVDQQGKAYYGVMVEEGTSKMRAQPYMYPTYQKEHKKLLSIMADVLRMRLMP